MQGRKALIQKVVLYPSLVKASYAQVAFVVIDRHNSRNNGTSNSNLSAIIEKLEEYISIIEELGDDKISTSINLETHTKKFTKKKRGRRNE